MGKLDLRAKMEYLGNCSVSTFSGKIKIGGRLYIFFDEQVFDLARTWNKKRNDRFRRKRLRVLTFIALSVPQVT